MPNARTNVNRTFKHKIGDSVFHANWFGKELGYSTHGKQVIKETPGILRAVNDLSKSRNSYYEDQNGRFQILRQKPKAGLNTNVSYILKIKEKKYFIKEVNDASTDKDYSFDIKHKQGRDGVSEHMAIEILKAQGINVIPAHFSYVDPTLKKSFIVYNFSQLKTPEELWKENKITLTKFTNIVKKLKIIESKINDNFHMFGLDKYSRIWDLATDNVFYSLKENKFYIFDPILLKKQGGK